MPKGGAKPGERRGGRQKGTPNKATTVRHELTEAAGLSAIHRHIAAPRVNALAELEGLIPIAKGHVAQFQRAALAASPESDKYNPALWKAYKEWFGLFSALCDTAADFRFPRLKATAVFTPPPPPGDVLEAERDADNVHRIQDANASARVYRNLVKAS